MRKIVGLGLLLCMMVLSGCTRQVGAEDVYMTCIDINGIEYKNEPIKEMGSASYSDIVAVDFKSGGSATVSQKNCVFTSEEYDFEE